jgi:hypothetical protein
MPGCSSPKGSRICDASVVKRLIEGKSTGADVVALLGQPNEVISRSDGSHEWKYEHASVLPSPRLELALLLTPAASSEATVVVCHLQFVFSGSDVLLSKKHWKDDGHAEPP